MLSQRQKLTIQHLKDHQKRVTPQKIVEYCQHQLSKPFWADDLHRARKEGRHKLPGSQTCGRNHRYYQEIIEHYLPMTGLQPGQGTTPVTGTQPS